MRRVNFKYAVKIKKALRGDIMGMTMSEKAFSRRSGKKVKVGDYVVVPDVPSPMLAWQKVMLR